MGIDTRTGQVAPNSGAYKTPTQSGQVAVTDGAAYRNAPIDTVSIDDIDYVPNGNVYERPSAGEVEMAYNGGAYEQPVLFEPAPPAHVFLLSVPYPLIFSDDMLVSAPIIEGDMWPFSDDIEVTNEVLSGTLASLLVTYGMQAESIELNTNEITAGTLETVLVTYGMQTEEMELGNEITGATLVTVLIVYSNWPTESFALASNVVTGGTLV